MRKIIALSASKGIGSNCYAVLVAGAAAILLLVSVSPLRAQDAPVSTPSSETHAAAMAGAAQPPAFIPRPAVAAAVSHSAMAQSPADRAASTLNLTVPNLLRDTDTLVRSVLVLLLLASMFSWTVWVAKTIELVRARRRLTTDLSILTRADSMVTLSVLSSEDARALVGAVHAELARAGDLRNAAGAEGLKERVTVRLLSVETALTRRMSAGISAVASIGATAPFVGLFGTVWGIMSSFIGIARLQTSNLIAVAPGIAEALLTTAAGLVAAVPAVLIYNGFTRSVSGYRALLADASNAAACVLSLDIEHLQQPDSARTLPLQEAVGGI